MRIYFGVLLISLFCASTLIGQHEMEKSLVQFSGLTVTEDEYGKITSLPYTTIAVKGQPRGTYSEIDGFFSLVVQKGDTLVFSQIGYKTVEHVVSLELDKVYYSWYQIMSKDDVLLPQAIIYPWPDREHYKIEFLALDISNELNNLAKENLAQELLDEMTFIVPPDGGETFALERTRAFTEAKYSGQYKPQRIFDPLAWAQFIKAWKRGDYKKKK